MSTLVDFSWHAGEREVQELLKVPWQDNPTYPSLSSQLAVHLQIAPLIAVGIVDEDGRPWTTVWGGDTPLAVAFANDIAGIRSHVARTHDPIIETLFGKEPSLEAGPKAAAGRMVSGLTIDLDKRKRVKFFGHVAGGGLFPIESTGEDEVGTEVQLALKIEQSLGNCPKYLNRRTIVPAPSTPRLISDSSHLPPAAIDLIDKADLFFISSARDDIDMDTNHRGGPPGFLRVLYNSASQDDPTVLIYPEYSGNRLYQTLGNLATKPLCGLCVPDFETGDVLYLTGHTETLVGPAAAELLPRSNLAVKITILSARFIATALPFRGPLALENGSAMSPYNPPVRFAATEKQAPAADTNLLRATLVSQTPLTSDVSRFKFRLNDSNPPSFTPGQYVTFDFSDHLDQGYSHMRDDDPQSLNDDFIRTFTISSAPAATLEGRGVSWPTTDFEVTMRKVGVATGYLFQQWGQEGRKRATVEDFEVNIKGFGGDFAVEQKAEEDKVVGFIAAGVGITPLLPSLWTLDLRRLKLLWSVRKEDIPLVLDVLQMHKALAPQVNLFITDATDTNEEPIQQIERLGVKIQARRMQKEDLYDNINLYYLCTGPLLRKQVIEWLPGKEVVFEDFGF